MPNLGTLDFDVRLKDETARQAEEIKSNLLTKLSVNFDPSSYQEMVANLRAQLSRETFEVKIATNMETARQSIQDSLNQIGQSARSATVDLNLGGTQGVDAMTKQIYELERSIHSLTQDVEEYKVAWQEAARVHGRTSSEAKAARAIYDKELRNLNDQKNMLFSLKKDKQELALLNKINTTVEKEATRAAKESEKAQKEAAKAAKERNATHVRLNGELLKGVRVSADLKEAFTSLYSVHMLREFLSNVIEIGGQLEKQRVSMGAILGDVSKANVLFEQIKGLAIKSPFGVVELDQYTKQLAAYGFQYNELFDMIKRLADISAGAGQDISRLTLALGHVRSQTYLTGYTMRQFSMNNIPMLKMLAEYYSELEKRVVSTAEVQERISKKQVSYEDVIEQIRRLTNEGGMFYNMQEKIAETVAAKWKNLRDAFSIMYGELAEGKIGDILKGVAEGLTSMAKEWRMMLSLITTAGAYFGFVRGSALLLNAALAQQEKIVTGNAIATSRFTMAQLRALASMEGTSKAAKILNATMGLVGKTLSNLLLSPALWWIVGLEAAAAAYTHFTNKAREAEDAMNSIYESANEGYKNLHQFAQGFADKNLDKMSDSDFAAGIKEFIQELKDYAPNAAQILKEADATETLREKYEYLRKELLNLEGAYKNLAEVGSMLTAANDSTDGWFDESFIENVEDYQDAIDDVDKSMNKLLQHQKYLDVALNNAASSDSGFSSATLGKSIKEQIEIIKDYPDALGVFIRSLEKESRTAYNLWSDYFLKTEQSLKDAKSTMQDDMDAYADFFDSQAIAKWGDKWKEDGMIVQSVMAGMKIQLEKSKIPMERIKEILDYIFKQKWQLDIDFGGADGTSGTDPLNEDQTDEFLKSIKERIKAIQDARKEYEALLELGMSSDNALDRIAFMGVANADVINYKEAIQRLAKQLGSGTAERREYQKEVGQYFLGIDKDVLKDQINKDKEELKAAVNEISDYIKKEGQNFNLYKSLLSKTGDEEFARQAFSNGQIWDEYADNLRENLENTMNMAVTNWNMSDSLAEKIFGKDTPALKLYQEIVEHIGENYTNALNDAADAMSKQQTTEEKIANLQRKINEWENDTSGIVDHTAQIEAAKNEAEELKQSLFSTLPVYEQIFGDTAYRSISSIKEGIRQMNEIISNAKENKDSKTGKAKSISSSYIDSNGVKQEVTLTLAEFRRLKEQGTKLFDAWKEKNPFSGLIQSFKNLQKVLNDKESDPEEKAEKWAMFSASIAECADIVGDFAGKLSNMFDALGNEGMASAMEDVQAGMNSISNIGKGFAEGGVFGGAIATAGEVVGWIGRIAGAHDKKLDKAIENSQREVKKLQNAYKNLEWEVGRQLTAITENQTKQMLESLNQQRRELEKQRELEAKKKKKDADKLIDYDQQIEEMKHQIADFYKEMANDMYGIDLDGWAGQIADAITDAFAKGEDAVSAFNDTVADIMNSVVKNIVKINVVKPAMEQLQDFLFGSNGIATLNSEGGVNVTPAEAKGLITQLDALRSKINDGKTIYETVAEAMKAVGIDPMGESTSTKSGLSRGIQGTTEETSNLLASYLNAVRADVSVIRRIMEVGSSSEDNPISQAQLLQLQVIAQNTAQTAQNTEAITYIYSLLRSNVNGVEFFHIK